MRTQLKFHALAITIICLTVIAVYLSMDRNPQQASPTFSPYSIGVESATWGMNCNPSITKAMANPKPAPPASSNKPTEKPETLTLATPNNVLSALKAACDNKPACQLLASGETLGVDPMYSCFKRLTVSYRCFKFDRLTTQDIGQGETFTIDCTKSKTTDAPASPQPH